MALKTLEHLADRLHCQFPGMMRSPDMSRQPGGPASVKLYLDYKNHLVKCNRRHAADDELAKPATSQARQ